MDISKVQSLLLHRLHSAGSMPLGVLCADPILVSKSDASVESRKRHPASPRPEQLTASPARVLTTEPLPDEIMELEDRPVPKVRTPKRKRPPRRLEAEKASLTPSPLNQRGRGRRKRRLRQSSQISDFDSEDAAGKKLPHFQRRLKLPHLPIATPRPSGHRGVSDRLKDDRPTHKQYLFV